MDDDIARLVERAQQQMSAQAAPNRFLDLLEAGDVPTDRLRWLAGELYRLVGSDQRSFALLAARFPAPPTGDLFLAMAQGESEALGLLLDFASAVGMGMSELRDYEPRPLAQAYPAFLTQTALFGTRSAVALAMLANVDESGRNYARVAEALRSRYGFADEAVAHFRYFAETPQSVLDQAASVVSAGLAHGEDPKEAVRVARMVHAYEGAFWAALGEGLDHG